MGVGCSEGEGLQVHCTKKVARDLKLNDRQKLRRLAILRVAFFK